VPHKDPERRAAYQREYEATRRDQERRRAYQREYVTAHKDSKKAYDNERYADKRAQILAAAKEYRSVNADAISQRRKTAYAADPVPHRIRGGVRFLKRSHGLWPEQFALLWKQQDGCCYLCGKPLVAGKQTHIDHDHSHCPADRSCSLCRRGLACQPCNILIGMARDDPGLLRRIASNLEVAQSLVTERLRDGSIQDSLWEAAS